MSARMSTCAIFKYVYIWAKIKFYMLTYLYLCFFPMYCRYGVAYAQCRSPLFSYCCDIIVVMSMAMYTMYLLYSSTFVWP